LTIAFLEALMNKILRIGIPSKIIGRYYPQIIERESEKSGKKNLFVYLLKDKKINRLVCHLDKFFTFRKLQST
jgi:hypothetical protein